MVLPLFTAVAVVGSAHSGTQAPGERSPRASCSSVPPSCLNPGHPWTGPPGGRPLPQLSEGLSPPRPRSRQAPSRCASIPPPAGVTRGNGKKLPSSCSRCHGSPASTWCRPPCPAPPRPAAPQARSATPQAGRPCRGLSDSGTDGSVSPRLRGLPRGTTGVVVRPTRVTPSDKRRTTAPDSPASRPASCTPELQLPECRACPARRAGPPGLHSGRWVASAACGNPVSFMHSLSPFPPPRRAQRCSANSSPGLVLESPSFELASSAVAAFQRQKLLGCPRKLATAHKQI